MGGLEGYKVYIFLKAKARKSKARAFGWMDFVIQLAIGLTTRKTPDDHAKSGKHE
jgi:hypothetical protein